MMRDGVIFLIFKNPWNYKNLIIINEIILNRLFRNISRLQKSEIFELWMLISLKNGKIPTDF